MKRLILLLVLISGSVSLGAIVEWSTDDGGNGHLYEPIEAQLGISWTQARDAAISSGGYLVTLTSQAENDFVFNLIDDDKYWYENVTYSNLRGPWIGGFQPEGSPEPDGDWQWVTGESFVFQNWNGVQPNNFGAGENFMHFGNQPTRTGEWNDLPADFGEVQAYVIEYVPEPTTIMLLGLGSLMLRKKRA
jgi:hypothetical protein